MGAHRTAKSGVLGRASSFVRGRPTTQKVGGGVAAALLASAPFGGLSSVGANAPGEIRLDQPFQIGPYSVVIDKVVELPDLDPAVPPSKGEKVLVLDAKIRNTTERPDYGVTLTDQMQVSGAGRIDVAPKPRLYSVDDASSLNTFNPGVEYRVAMTYVTGGRWQGKSVTLKIERLEFVVEGKLGLDKNSWRPREGVEWQGTFPVERKS